MSQFIDNLIDRYDAHILIIPEFIERKQDSYDDYYVSKKILEQLKHKQYVSIIEGDYPPSKLKAIVGNCDVIVSPRFHMVIFALSQHIPSLAIAYSPKAYGIMEMLGQLEYLLDIKDLTLKQLMEKFDNLKLDKNLKQK